ncbi:N-methyl-L-tryptophan oxidase [Candidatus Poribacteria bacterium]|nr:MAG: N-methyl-L-tryptophan oxidase [Candidatus Poribacteria bacterium]
MPSHIYDTIIIGAGGMGSAATYHLAKSGADILTLDQFQRGHTHGSSHGDNRIIRFFYDKHFYTELMKTAYDEWRSLEQASGRSLLYISGSVNLGEKGNQYAQTIRRSLDMAGVEYEEWDKLQLRERFPQFNVSGNMDILWQQDTGFLHANKCVSTHLQMAEKLGARIQENTEVTRIDWQVDIPTVYTKENKFRARKIVITAGAWTSYLVRELDLPLTVTKQQVCYYRPTDTESFQPNRFPVFTEVTSESEFMYGMPYFGEKGVKVARHGMGKTILPDSSDRSPDSEYIDHMDKYLMARIPELGKAYHAEVCLYTETPDEDFIIDVHPHCPNILIAAGFSGHGFKFCSLVGRIMCEMVLNGRTAFNISHFRIGRPKPSGGILYRLQKVNN